MIFDYWSPTDFKFAGIDVATNKIVMGHRTADGWVVDVQGSVPGSLRSDTFYSMLIAVNGTTVTAQIDGTLAFAHTFAARTIDGEAVGLNKGLVGMGSDNARGVFDNVFVQTTPPGTTIDVNESFDDGAAQYFTGAKSGTWTLSGGRYASTAAAGANAFATVDLGRQLASTSYLEVQSTLRATAIGGVVFDHYADNDFKFAALDVAGQRVVVGHVDPRRGYVVDASIARALAAGTDYQLGLVFNGTTVSVTVNGAFALSYAFNAALVDGGFGVLSRGGTTSVDSNRVRTSDPGFTSPGVTAADISVNEGNAGTTVASLTLTLAQAALVATSVRWATSPGTAAAGGDYVTASGIATFAAGATTAQVDIPIVGDAVWEANETFIVVLSSPTGLWLQRDFATVTIVNDDKPSLSIANASVTEGNSSSKTVAVTVSLSSAATSIVTVAYATANGTATSGSDYKSQTGTVTFAVGVTTQTILFTVYGDRTNEANETFQVVLSNAVNANIGTGTATVTILNDDGALTASAAAPASSAPTTLTSAELEAAVTEAKADWLAAKPDADLAGITVSVADLDGLLLGLTVDRTIEIDATAAGWGWSQIDLVTVVRHELGHVLGFSHDDEDEYAFLAETLGVSTPALSVPATARPWISSALPGAISAGVRPGIAVGRPIHTLRPRAKEASKR